MTLSFTLGKLWKQGVSGRRLGKGTEVYGEINVAEEGIVLTTYSLTHSLTHSLTPATSPTVQALDNIYHAKGKSQFCDFLPMIHKVLFVLP